MQTWFDENEAKNKVLQAIGGESFFWKYVRVGEEYRFIDAITIFSASHESALKENEKAKSAGFIRVHERGFQVRGYSMTLNIGPAEDDEDKIAQLLGPKTNPYPSALNRAGWGGVM